MTPAKLHALADTHKAIHDTSDDSRSKPKPEKNPAAALAALGAEF